MKVVAIYTDFSKVLDRFDHDIPKTKLQASGLSNNIESFWKTYLSEFSICRSH